MTNLIDNFHEITLNLAKNSFEFLASKKKKTRTEIKLCENTIHSCLQYFKSCAEYERGDELETLGHSLDVVEHKCAALIDCIDIISKLIVDLSEKDRLHPASRENINETLEDCLEIIEEYNEEWSQEVEIPIFKRIDGNDD